jgi:CTP:molybdopterin cytidylyltransferase MocA
MGRPKLLLPWNGTSVLGCLIERWQSLGAGQVALVCASGDQAIPAELDRLAVPNLGLILNPVPERGMFSSIQCAARWSGWVPTLTHWAVVLGDQPHLRAETLRAIVQSSAAHPAEICQPSRGGRPRHPVLLPRPAFLALAESPASTLKEFLLPFRPALCELDDPRLDLDIDLPADYATALQWAQSP